MLKSYLTRNTLEINARRTGDLWNVFQHKWNAHSEFLSLARRIKASQWRVQNSLCKIMHARWKNKYVSRLADTSVGVQALINNLYSQKPASLLYLNMPPSNCPVHSTVHLPKIAFINRLIFFFKIISNSFFFTVQVYKICLKTIFSNLVSSLLIYKIV